MLSQSSKSENYMGRYRKESYFANVILEEWKISKLICILGAPILFSSIVIYTYLIRQLTLNIWTSFNPMQILK